MRFMRKMVILAAGLTLALCTMSCSDETEEIKVIIISSGAGFSGYYFIDDDYGVFEDDSVSGSVYSRTLYFEDVDDIDIYAMTDGDAYSLTISVYRDGSKVKSSYVTGSSEPLYLNVTYELGEEDDDE